MKIANSLALSLVSTLFLMPLSHAGQSDCAHLIIGSPETAAFYVFRVNASNQPNQALTAVTVSGAQADHVKAILEAGKQVRVEYTGGLVNLKTELGSDVQFILGYKIAGKEDSLPLDLEFWLKDSPTNKVTATFDVPDSSSGKIEFWFEARLPTGEVKYDSRGGKNYPFSVIPRGKPVTAFFDKDLNETISGPLRAGSVIRVHYEPERLLKNLGLENYRGTPVVRMKGFVSFRSANGAEIETFEFPVVAKQTVDEGIFRDKRYSAPILIPSGAVSVSFWFRGEGPKKFDDGNLSNNYTFPVSSN